jgi:hypothetical protein
MYNFIIFFQYIAANLFQFSARKTGKGWPQGIYGVIFFEQKITILYLIDCVKSIKTA